jgi:SAM-dependent methyltransferase
MAGAPPLTLGAWLRYDIVGRLLERDGTPSSVLEIGAGRGSMGWRLARTASYTGVEPDDMSRAAAVATLPPGASVVADLADVPAGTFDLVCAFEVLEHIDDDAGALAAWAERVAPGGRMMLSTPAHADRFGPSDEIVGHVRRYDAPDLAALVRGAGLDVVEVQHWGFPLGYLLEAARNRIAARRLATTWAGRSVEERNAASGRYLQPPRWAGPAMQLASAPFRVLQRPAARTSLGTGLLLLARRPAR